LAITRDLDDEEAIALMVAEIKPVQEVEVTPHHSCHS
jgi:hypothetical protein